MLQAIYLDPCPVNEDCIQMGVENYQSLAKEEAEKFIELLVNLFGNPPSNSSLKYEFIPHDFGDYCQVVYHYDSEVQVHQRYALSLDNYCPLLWDGSIEFLDDEFKHKYSTTDKVEIQFILDMIFAEINWRTYSGRYMFGRYCPAVVCNNTDEFMKVAKATSVSLKHDDLGKGKIYYTG